MVERDFTRIADDARCLVTRLQESVALIEALCSALEGMGGAPHHYAEACGDAARTETLPTAGAAGSGEVIQVYWIGCHGLERAARRLGSDVRIDRIGTTTERELADRLNAASADAYGSWTRDAGGNLVQQAGFTSWIMQAIHVTRGTTDPAITVKTRSIAIALPPGLTRRRFDRALHIALEGWSLARTHPGAQRFTNYSVGVDRMSKAVELYTRLDPRRDGDRLLGLVERILAAHRRAQSVTTADAMPASQTAITAAAPAAVPAALSPGRRAMSAAQFRAMRARKAYVGRGGYRRTAS